MAQLPGMQIIDGCPCFIPNQTLDGEGFYVSYNNHDNVYYGSATTALVAGQGQAFFTLNGDHRKQYLELIPKGWDACMEYFKANYRDINRFSEIPEEPEKYHKIIADYIVFEKQSKARAVRGSCR